MSAVLKILRVVSACLAIVFILLEWPEIIVNSKVIRFAGEYLAPKWGGVQAYWDGLATEVHSISFFEKSVRIRFDGLCARNAEQGADACFDTMDLSFAYQFRSVLPKITRVGPARILGGDVYIAERAVPAKPLRKGKPKGGQLALPSWLAGAKFEPIDIRIPKIRMDSSAGRIRGSAELSERDERVQGTFRVSERDRSGKKVFSGDLALEAVPAPHAEIQYRVRDHFRSPEGSGAGTLEGWIASDRITGALNENLATPAGARVEIADCRFDYFSVHQVKRRGKFKVQCPLLADLRPRKRPVAIATADLFVPFPPSSEGEVSGTAGIQPGGFLAPGLLSRGGVSVDFAAQLSDLPNFEQFNGAVDLSMSIPRFEKLVRELSNSTLAVPAPIQALRGTVMAHFRGGFGVKGGKIGVALATRLRSPRGTQRLNTQGTGDVGVQAGTKPIVVDVGFDLLLADVRLTAPKLAVGAVPQLLPDPRLTAERISKASSKVARRSGFELRYRISVKTKAPLELASSLTPAPVPVRLDLLATQKIPLQGQILVERFPVKALGQREEVGDLKINLNLKQSGGVLAGNITLQNRSKKPIEVSPTQLAGQAAGQSAEARSGPQLQIPAAEVVSSVLTGIPVSALSLNPGTSSQPPRREEDDRAALVQLERRY